MADHLKATFEKYQFWAFVTAVGLLITLMTNWQAEIKKDSAETRREIAGLSRQLIVVTTKLENYEASQASMKSEMKEINTRLSSIEMRMTKYESERK